MNPIQYPIYLDHHATTPLAPSVLEAMLPFLTSHFGNAASQTHSYGWVAEGAVNKARAQIARTLGCKSKEIIFTSGATESNNIALLGLASGKKRHIITSAIEHKAVLSTIEFLRTQGCTVTVLPVNNKGQINLKDLENAITADTLMASIMWANNEMGALHPIQQIGALCRQRGVIFHCDGVQGLSTHRINLKESSVDLFSLSGHKIYGPKGVGALYCREDLLPSLTPLFYGGQQENSLRPGTLNVPGIVGLGTACEFVFEQSPKKGAEMREMRDQLLQKILSGLADTSPQWASRVEVNSDCQEGLPHNLNVTFHETNADALLSLIGRHIAVSAGSACQSMADDAGGSHSHVLDALGKNFDPMKTATIRFGLGYDTKISDIEKAAHSVVASLSTLWKGRI